MHSLGGIEENFRERRRGAGFSVRFAPAATFIMSLSGLGRKEDFKKIGLLCIRRYEGNRSEDQIAEELEFTSAEAMHIQLKNWQLPEWLTQKKASEVEGKEQKAWEGGEAVKLPPPAEPGTCFAQHYAD